MPRLTRAIPVAVAVLALMRADGVQWSFGSARPAGIPSLAPTLPQRASGDFDGDGRPDLAIIREIPGGSQLLVRLSGPSASIQFETSIVSLVAADIDHDGDLDLIASTPSGDLLVWLNDGSGGFTRQDRSMDGPVMATAAVTDRSAADRAALITASALPISLAERTSAPVLIGSRRLASNFLLSRRSILFAPGLRAPPLPAGLI